MDTNNNELNPIEKMVEKEVLVEDVFSNLQETNTEQAQTINNPYKTELSSEPKIITYQENISEKEELPKKEKSAKKFLFILILGLILIVGGFIIWVIL